MKPVPKQAAQTPATHQILLYLSINIKTDSEGSCYCDEYARLLETHDAFFNCLYRSAVNSLIVLKSHQARLNRNCTNLSFDIDERVRQVLDAQQSRPAKLSRFFSRKEIQFYLAALPSKALHVPIVSDRKLIRRSIEHRLADETLSSKRSQVAAVRLGGLRRTNEKVTSLQKTAEMINILTYTDNQRVLAALRREKNGDMQIDGDTSETSLSNTVSLASQAASHAVDMKLSDKREKIANTGLKQHPGRKTLSEAAANLPSATPGPSRAELLAAQVKALEDMKKATKEAHSSEDMERYLHMTTQFVQNFFDPNLDPRGKPWTFEEIIYGDIHNKRAVVPINSPWSGRSLKPIIRVDYETEPLKLRLLLEIEHRQFVALPEWIAPPRPPIEYRYLRPHMLKQVNQLLIDNFWPGIDMGESLLCPEHTVVALFKELVIGCGFITSFGYITYICVHPEWQGAGIGKFMLYHLIQTCPGSDITLHVSCTNTAMLLYQSFCFKVEETVKRFYNKFLPSSSKLSRDAFFMRLRR